MFFIILSNTRLAQTTYFYTVFMPFPNRKQFELLRIWDIISSSVIQEQKEKTSTMYKPSQA